MRFQRSRLMLFLIVFLFPIFSDAANFRCNGRFVDGYTKIDLLSNCGDPVYTDSYSKSTSDGGHANNRRGVCERIDQWYYMNTDTKTTYVLEIERGFVVRVLRSRAR